MYAQSSGRDLRAEKFSQYGRDGKYREVRSARNETVEKSDIDQEACPAAESQEAQPGDRHQQPHQGIQGTPQFAGK